MIATNPFVAAGGIIVVTAVFLVVMWQQRQEYSARLNTVRSESKIQHETDQVIIAARDADIAAQKGKLSKLEDQVRILRDEPIQIRMIKVSHSFVVTALELNDLTEAELSARLESRVTSSLALIRQRCEKEMLVQWTDPEIVETELGSMSDPSKPGKSYEVYVGAMPNFGRPNLPMRIHEAHRPVQSLVENDGQEIEIIRSTIEFTH